MKYKHRGENKGAGQREGYKYRIPLHYSEGGGRGAWRGAEGRARGGAWQVTAGRHRWPGTRRDGLMREWGSPGHILCFACFLPLSIISALRVCYLCESRVFHCYSLCVLFYEVKLFITLFPAYVFLLCFSAITTTTTATTSKTTATNTFTTANYCNN